MIIDQLFLALYGHFAGGSRYHFSVNYCLSFTLYFLLKNVNILTDHYIENMVKIYN